MITFKEMLAKEQAKNAWKDLARRLQESVNGAVEGMDEDEPIANSDIYLSNMSKSFPDKAWFVKYLDDDIETLVDFGGGAGEFCEYVDSIVSKHGRRLNYVIIDNNPEFISAAESKGFLTFSSLSEMMSAKACDPTKSILVMSSVIHEIYSYQEENGPAENFWAEVGECDFHQIAIRDMSMNERSYRDIPTDAVLWVYENVFMNGKLQVKGVPLYDQVESFEDRWGAICDVRARKVNVKNLVHFLVKYRYVENWAREVNEDYFPVSQARLQSILQSMGYRLARKESSRLEFYSKQWAKDFKLNIPDTYGYRKEFWHWLTTLNTHIKWLAVK